MGSSYNESTKTRKAKRRECEKEPPHHIWSTYGDIYDILAVNPDKVQTTEECVANTRIIDVATTKLLNDVQKLDFVDLWSDIAERLLIIGWDKFFDGPENTEDWSLGDMIPLNRYKSNFFTSKSLFLNRESKPAQKNKKTHIRKKDDNSQTKMAKPLQGLSEDKPPLLMENMERIKSALNKLCTRDNPSISYMRLVLHPTSFSHTVYNIFALAFLIRERMVSLAIGNNGEPMVNLGSNFYSENSAKGYKKKYNFLIFLTTDEWQMLVNKLDIKSPLIPPPDGIDENDQFFEKFTMSQKEKRKKGK